ncbi:MAG TPA: TetR/AcrR family transcriptional regulator [Candidatus Dormibacteraeota bacterium]|nr:TetR/AcrR family transcriptional regulator [Candidatus Dormibacteraeota bacterium]
MPGAISAGADRPRQIVAAALRILEREGPEALTMRRLATAVGIRAPSLYKHFADKAEVEQALIAEGLAELGGLVGSWSGERGGDFGRIARGYRRFALERPHLYRLMTERPLDRERLPAGVEERGVAPLVALLGTRDRARAAWAFAHGMVQLELAGRFPPDADLDAAWEVGIGAFAATAGV